MVSYKTKHTLTTWSSKCVLWYLLKGVEHLCSSHSLHKDVHSGFIHNCQNLEAARCPSAGEWINPVRIRTTALFSTKKKWAIKSWKDMEETNTYYREKKPIWKVHTLYDILEKAKRWRQLKDYSSQGVVGGWGMSKRRRQWHPTPVLLPGKSHGRRSLVGCSPWGRWVGHDWATSLSLFTFLHWRRKWQPPPVFLPGESQGQGSLVGCRLWGHTESDMTEVT